MMRDYDEILADLDMWASIQPEAAEAIRALLDRIDELEGDAEPFGHVFYDFNGEPYFVDPVDPEYGEGFDVYRRPPTERAVPEGMMLFPKMEWRPIETAPVDGKAFLVWVPENKCVFEVISRSYKGAAQMTLFGSFGLEFTHNATHWMPLPAAPGAGGGE